MTLGRFLLRRAAFALLLTFVASSAALVLTLLGPGDFAADDGFLDPEFVAARRAQLGLDRPVLIQYADWVGRAVRLDFGESLLYSRPVSDLLGERAMNTAVLAAAALGAATLFGVPLGIYTGARQRGLWVTLVRGLSLLMLSMPPLIASLALVLLGWWLLTDSYQRGSVAVLTGLGTVLALVGGLFYVDGAPQLTINPVVVGVIVLAVLFFYAIAMPTVARSRFSTRTIGRDHLVGSRGTALVDFDPDGEVDVSGARWRASAHREAGIRQGDVVRIAEVDGLVLEVEPVAPDAAADRENQA